jgi:hypothetical protein
VPIKPENRDRYPADWKEIRERIMERAVPEGAFFSQCECRGECGRRTHDPGRCPNRHGFEAYNSEAVVVLTVAHLDHTPENCDERNLRAMCQGCHLHYDIEHHRQSRLASERAAREASGQLTLAVG